MTRYTVKLTDAKDQTRNATRWGPRVRHEGRAKGSLCTAGWIHCYESSTLHRAALIAALHDPVQANFGGTAHLWIARGSGVRKIDGIDPTPMKVGYQRLRTIERIGLPQVTAEQRSAYGILAASQVYRPPAYGSEEWHRWALAWLDGSDRSSAAVEAAEAAAAKAARAAWAAEAAAAKAAWAAAAAKAAWAAWAAKAAWAAAKAAWAAAAEAAAKAARAAARAEAASCSAPPGFDLGRLAELACGPRDRLLAAIRARR